MNVSVTRRRLEMQGYRDLNDETISEIGVWLRFAPALCAVLVGAATVRASVALLIAVTATAVAGALLPHHPFEYLYQFGFRHLTGTRRLPPNGAPRRFACAFSVLWLGFTIWAFAAGALYAGRVLGGMFVAVALVPTLTDFCVPSFIYQLTAGRLSTPPVGARS